VKVTVEDIPEVPLGSKGILVRIKSQEGKNLGKLWIGSAHVRWAQGSTMEKNAKKLPVQKFVDFLNELP